RRSIAAARFVVRMLDQLRRRTARFTRARRRTERKDRAGAAEKSKAHRNHPGERRRALGRSRRTARWSRWPSLAALRQQCAHERATRPLPAGKRPDNRVALRPIKSNAQAHCYLRLPTVDSLW